jgi:hypothetical protein
MGREPVRGEASDLVERAGLFEQVRGAGHDDEFVQAPQFPGGGLAQLQPDLISTANGTGEIRAATAGHDRGDDRSGRAGARPEAPDRQRRGSRVVIDEVHCQAKMLRQQTDIEAEMHGLFIDGFLSFGQKIE